MRRLFFILAAGGGGVFVTCAFTGIRAATFLILEKKEAFLFHTPIHQLNRFFILFKLLWFSLQAISIRLHQTAISPRLLYYTEGTITGRSNFWSSIPTSSTPI